MHNEIVVHQQEHNEKISGDNIIHLFLLFYHTKFLCIRLALDLSNVVFRILYTPSHHQHLKSQNDFLSFVQIFRDLGYLTYWFSKHSPQKRVHTFCEEAAVCEYVEESVYDEDLVDKLSFLHNSSTKSLVILHMLGSHIDYNERVPDDFKYYKPLCTGNVSGCSKESLDNSYDNTILYTDTFIAAVIEKLKDKNACLVYTSDHGESLGEGEFMQRYGHSTPYNVAPKEQKDVPLILWFSDKYLQTHKNIDLKKIAAHQESSHDNIFETVLECGGITHKSKKQSELNLLLR